MHVNYLVNIVSTIVTSSVFLRKLGVTSVTRGVTEDGVNPSEITKVIYLICDQPIIYRNEW